MKVHEYTRIENKLGLQSRNAGDRLSWFEHEGVEIVRAKRSHGNKDLPEHLIRQQLKLNEKQFSDLIDCPLTREGYIDILTQKGLIKKPAKETRPGSHAAVVDVPSPKRKPVPSPKRKP